MGNLLYYFIAVLGVVISSIFGAGSSIAYAQQEFRGRGCIITANAYCQARGYRVGDCAQVRFVPPNMFGNGNNTRLSFFFPTYAQNYRQDGSAIGATYKNVNFSWVGRSGGNASESLTKWRIPLAQPANYSLPYVHLVVDLFRYDDFDPSDRSFCNVRWRVTAQKYPEGTPSVGSADASLPALDVETSPAPLGNTVRGFDN